ncbi:MAG TPA: glycosyltransferase family 1 protein [Solirubrobacteraceae bacterium]|jgi:glycosyltransferase involved in cell wall biosynthesis|nr:glycosyltransferase family 1 protein [Solirubrobacteraceae bacterium]
MGAPVTVVVTHGPGSLDLCSQRLADHLPPAVRRLHTEVLERSGDRFEIPLLSRRALHSLRLDAAFARRLRRERGIVHLTNHHLGRYAGVLREPYVMTLHDVMRLHDLRGADPPYICRLTARDRAMLRLDYAGVRHAAAVTVPSEFAARDATAHLGIPPARITVVRWAVDHDLFRPVERRLYAFPYVLYVGTEQPRKNLGALLRAFALLSPAHPDLRLVKVGLAGGEGSEFRRATRRAIDALGIGDRVVFTGRLPDEDLVAAYAGAVCSVLPSRHEGFGLPPLEAMACGCPVVVSSAGSLPEVVGDAGLVVDPGPWPLADAIATTLDPAVREDLRERGLRRAASFTWQAAAERTLTVYRAVGGDVGPPPLRVAAGGPGGGSARCESV